MCGILGFSGPRPKNLKKAITLLKNRGKDGTTIKKIGDITLIHSLHAIVGHTRQPITQKGTLIANCEIYNYQQLAQKYHLKYHNDAQILCYLLDMYGISILKELDGVYAFAHLRKSTLTLARDILGEKPLWYSYVNNQLLFASKKKMLEAINCQNIEELHPRHILTYNLKSHTLKTTTRPFFTIKAFPSTVNHPSTANNSTINNIVSEQETKEYLDLKKKTLLLLKEAIIKRIPPKNRKCALLFSGGVDSAVIAHVLQEQGVDLTCYVTAIDHQNIESSDLKQAIAAAKKMNLKLKVIKINLNQYQKYLPLVVNRIEDTNVIKVSVAIAFHAASIKAAKDGCKVIFSGLGAEEIFAGYDRHKHATSVNDECLSGLRKIYERDLYRDDTITMNCGVELRLPFLDLNLIRFGLNIPVKYKLKDGTGKFILRDLAEDLGLPHEVAWAKKVAAQYGSRSDYAMEKLTKKLGFPSRSTYLHTLRPNPNLHLGVMHSGGKDSTYAAYLMKRQNYELSCLINISCKNRDSYMFQTAGIEVVPLQAKAMDIPLLTKTSSGIKEKELQDLTKVLRVAKKQYHIEGIVTGAVASTYQRNRIEQVCEKVGLKIFSPLWQKDQEMEMRELLSSNFKFILTKIASDGLTSEFLGKEFTSQDLTNFLSLQQKNKMNINGEGGEFESIVLNCPLFNKELVIKKSHLNKEDKYTAELIIDEAHLIPK